jgi:prevent-host-death family protein
VVSRSSRVPLSLAKAKLSELVRSVGADGREVVLTVDGEPAARLVPVPAAPRRLTPPEIQVVRVLMAGLARIPRSAEPFDAAAVVREGRR